MQLFSGFHFILSQIYKEKNAPFFNYKVLKIRNV